MHRVVSAEEMRWCDTTTIRSIGIPGLLLMENAGSEVSRTVIRRYGSRLTGPVVILCGKGNNGGDGFVVARHLTGVGVEVVLVLLSQASTLKGDARTNFRILKKLEKLSSPHLRLRPVSGLSSLRPSLVIDAIFGTGFAGSPKGAFAKAIAWVNRQECPVVSVDIPSGVNGTTGEAESAFVRADVTVTMGALKSGLLLNQGMEASGELEVVDIGIPPSILMSPRLKTSLMESQDVRLPRRSKRAHKYSAGKVFVLAGSRGYTGAAALTATGALRSGAGAVVLGTPESVYPILAKKLSEVIVSPLPATSDGTVALAGFDGILERISWADVAVIGPGLSRNKETVALVRKILKRAKGKILLDADALNALGNNASSMIRSASAEIIVTPHTGEFSRMTGESSSAVEIDRIGKARAFSTSARSIAVLKGAPTVTAFPDGEVVLNSTGNPGLATVGSGDVLSGIVGGLWAQGMTGKEAAGGGVFIHGLSGDLAADALGSRSIVAQDLIGYLPSAMRMVGERS